MQYVTWTTCDTGEIIPIAAIGEHPRPTYMLQPNSEPTLLETDYQGDGIFGGIDAYTWLALANEHLIHGPLPTTDNEIIQLGMGLAHGYIALDTRTDQIWHIHYDNRALIPGQLFEGTYSDRMPAYNDTADNLINRGILAHQPIRDLLALTAPLKFSFYPGAVYELYSASEPRIVIT